MFQPAMRLVVAVSVSIAIAGCQKSGDRQNKSDQGISVTTSHGSGSAGRPRPKIQQVTPPFDVKSPPADATRNPSGLVLKKIVSKDGVAPKRNDTVLINFTVWKQSNGETFFTTKQHGQPKPLNLSTAAPGFAEAMQLTNKGEKVMLWLPVQLAHRGKPPAEAEPLAFEVEIVDVVPAPAIPDDVAAPPANARTLASGVKAVTIRPGTGNEKPRSFDTATFNYTGWESDGRMFDTTEMKKRPYTVAPYRQPPPMADVLTSMTAGERVRFWIDAEKMKDGKAVPGLPSGQLCYELELLQIAKAASAPPPAPPDVAKPPADAKKTPRGVAYRVLKAGKGGPKPKSNDSVRLHFTGWTSDGKMFDSSAMKGEPSEFSLRGVIAGWTEAIPLMSVGDKYRMWIPAELAYKGAPNRPQGMLVYEVELAEIKEPKAPKADPHGGHGDSHGDDHDDKLPPPPDVAAPPTDAKKSPKGVSYKVLKPGAGGAKPKATDRVKVHYTGWTTAGDMFDSSVTKGKPAEFALTQVIAGWTDALQLMSVGDKYRLWIPEELAYKDKPGRPQGMLVFDVELLEIK